MVPYVGHESIAKYRGDGHDIHSPFCLWDPHNMTANIHKKRKVLPEPKVHRAALISILSALSQPPVYTARPWIRG